MNPVKPQTTANKDTSKLDPTVELRVGEDIFVLVFDYKVATAITRLTGLSPLVRGLYPILETHPEGLEICLWAMLTQMGPKWAVPTDQRNLKREEIQEWFEDLGFAQECVLKLFDALAAAMPKKADEEEGENGENPQTQAKEIVQ